MDNSLGAVTDSGQLVKMEVDYSATCDEKLPQLCQMAVEGRLNEALAGLMALEKCTRTGADMQSTSRVLVNIVQVCFDARAFDLLNEHIVALCKRRSQLKQSVARMVQRACEFVEKLDGVDRRNQLRLIDTLRTVTEGKIYVEVERARLTHRLARMREADGDIDGAANIMKELQVETYGSMERTEKVTLILEQMRLCLLRKDFIRTQIISKKINIKFFDSEDTRELKLKYYRLMIELDQNIGTALSVCQHYLSIYRTQTSRAESNNNNNNDNMDADVSEETDPLPPLRRAIIYLLLAESDPEQNDLAQRLLTDKRLIRHLPEHAALLQLFCQHQLIDWQLMCSRYEHLLRDSGQDGSEVLTANTAEGQSRWQQLQLRVREHNIAVIARYYRRIRLQRMAELLALSVDETENLLADLVVAGRVRAKTDRLDGIVSFEVRQQPVDLLAQWSSSVDALMSLVGKTTHLINKEEMVHKHLASGGGVGGAQTAVDA